MLLKTSSWNCSLLLKPPAPLLPHGEIERSQPELCKNKEGRWDAHQKAANYPKSHLLRGRRLWFSKPRCKFGGARSSFPPCFPHPAFRRVRAGGHLRGWGGGSGCDPAGCHQPKAKYRLKWGGFQSVNHLFIETSKCLFFSVLRKKSKQTCLKQHSSARPGQVSAPLSAGDVSPGQGTAEVAPGAT